jgi:serine-type D-Ala-D-Ala carboxypeptidase/endopeptidase (penicillin-binding protein 4)
MLPELGVDGSLATSCEDCPAKSKVFAKPGTVALPDLVNGRLTQAESLGGYMESESGQYHVFYLVVNGATAQDIEDAVKILDDLNDISADLQKDASQQGEKL